jgi:hypothetical protein
MAHSTALNIAGNDYEISKIDDAYTVAEAAGFKLFYSFDMSYSWQQSDLVAIISKHAQSPSTFRWQGMCSFQRTRGELRRLILLWAQVGPRGDGDTHLVCACIHQLPQSLRCEHLALQIPFNRRLLQLVVLVRMI